VWNRFSVNEDVAFQLKVAGNSGTFTFSSAGNRCTGRHLMLSSGPGGPIPCLG
jgi:hypothetical protein